MKLKALSLFQLKQKDILLSVVGGVNKNNVSDYSKLGIRLFITSLCIARGYKGGDWKDIMFFNFIF